MIRLLLACSAPPSPAPPPAEEAAPGPDPGLFVPGVVAARDLPAGAVLTADDLKLGLVPDFTPSPIRDPAPLVGSTVREPILGGEPLRVERTVPGEGWAALAEAGVAAGIEVPPFAAIGIGPGCEVEVVEASDPERRPKLAVQGAVRVLGLLPGSDERIGLMVEAPAPIAARPLTVVVRQLRSAEENPSEPVFRERPRPGRPIAVARHPLLAGVFIRSSDLGEIGGEGLEGIGMAQVWARTPHQRILPGEIVRPERIATDTTGLCVKIPDGMRAVGVPTEAGAAAPDRVDGLISIRIRGHEIRDLYVLAADPAADVLTVAANPEIARAIAVVAATTGGPFRIGP